MKTTSLPNKPWYLIIALGTVVLGTAVVGICRAQVTISPPNYTVTTPGAQFEFNLNGQNSGQPQAFANVDNSVNFSLPAGATYVFQMNTTAFEHPVDICTNSTITSHYVGASAQVVTTGTVTVTIPTTNYPTNLYYICNNHLFYGIITVTPPQPPPPTTIVQTAVSTNVTLTFTGGTNTIPLTPQFNSNLVTGAWSPVPSYTNNFGSTSTNTFSGTNTIVFGRLDAICGPNVFLRITQATN